MISGVSVEITSTILGVETTKLVTYACGSMVGQDLCHFQLFIRDLQFGFIR